MYIIGNNIKKIFLGIMLLSIVSAAAQANDGSRYASQSVLATGRWVKISVDHSGIYSLSYEDIKAMGIEPQNVRIYGYGGGLLSEDFSTPYVDDLPEVPIDMQKGADGIFNEGDRILFYAQANIIWRYNSQKGTFSHIRNHYSDLGYYFVTSKSGSAKQIPTMPEESGMVASTIASFNDYLLQESEIKNEAQGGRVFYGEKFSRQTPSYSFSIYRPDIEGIEAKMFVDMANKTIYNNNIEVNINGVIIKTIPLKRRPDNNYQVLESTNDTVTFVPNSTNTFNITLTSANPSLEAYLNYFEINFKRKLSMTGNELYFRSVDYIGRNQLSKFVLSGVDADTEIWDITDRNNIEKVNTTLSGRQLSFVANTNELRQFVAISTRKTFPKPNIVGTVDNQSLHSLPQVDMIIISHSDFLGEAYRLAEYHRAKEGISVNVADAEAIYNEFSSGTPDATAYRRFVKMFYDRSQTQGTTTPKWLLLLGDGIYDNRGIISGSDEYRKLLTYQAYNSVNKIHAYTSDDYFGYLDDTDMAMSPSASLDIGIGRLPVYTVQQAKAAIDKTIAYIDNKLHGEWKNRMLFIADDGDNNIHIRDCDSIANFTQRENNDILIKKLYLDAYKQETSASSENYPLVNNILDNYIRQGVLLINYMGHGSHIQWSNENILDIDKITSMVNDKYPIFITATCDFSAYDQFDPSGGEQLIWNPIGGTMALITTTRTVYASANADLNYHLLDNIFDADASGNPLSMGEILRKAKNEQTASDNKFSFTLLGDPSLRLNYPYQAKVVTDSINHMAITAQYDTISALSEVTLSGHIANLSGNIINGYNGALYINIFDKVEKVKTLANDKGSTPFEYKDRPNIIFRGSTYIDNGKWSVKFLVPKDIKYDFGKGRIVYYATENGLGIEANGSFEDFIIGGENPNPPLDNEGPQVQLFINSRAFKEGQKVNASPLFIADLYDNSGINTTGCGIGHDIVLRKNVGDKEEIVLNDYYESNLGDYRSGTIKYQIDNLEKGVYNMWFRAWDLQNNSTSKQITFEVTDQTSIDAQVMVYPNPAKDFVKILITHDRPYKALNTTLQIYDVTGRFIADKHMKQASLGNRTELTLNFVADRIPINRGIYFIRIVLSTDGEKSTSKPIKLIIQ